LADSTGANVIKGVSFYITGDEPNGFEIDNVTFGAASVLANVGRAAPVLPSLMSVSGLVAAALLLIAGFRLASRAAR
jgi:hypothetical protein